MIKTWIEKLKNFRMVGKTVIHFTTHGCMGEQHEFDYVGKTVIHFTTHGCMGEQHEFDYIGIIVGKTYPKYCDGKMFYKVKVLKNKNGYELRNSEEEKYEEIPSWYLQNLGGNFYCIYD